MTDLTARISVTPQTRNRLRELKQSQEDEDDAHPVERYEDVLQRLIAEHGAQTAEGNA